MNIGNAVSDQLDDDDHIVVSIGVHAAVGGLMAVTGYGIVLWAMSRGAMAPVASLRETGVLIAAVIGTRMLGEPFGRQRILAAAGAVAGLVMVQL